MGKPVPEYQRFMGARMMEMVVTTGAIRQSDRHHQHMNTQLFTGRMPFLSPNQQYQSTEGRGCFFWKHGVHIEYLLLSSIRWQVAGMKAVGRRPSFDVRTAPRCLHKSHRHSTHLVDVLGIQPAYRRERLDCIWPTNNTFCCRFSSTHFLHFFANYKTPKRYEERHYWSLLGCCYSDVATSVTIIIS